MNGPVAEGGKMKKTIVFVMMLFCFAILFDAAAYAKGNPWTQKKSEVAARIKTAKDNLKALNAALAELQLKHSTAKAEEVPAILKQIEESCARVCKMKIEISRLEVEKFNIEIDMKKEQLDKKNSSIEKDEKNMDKDIAKLVKKFTKAPAEKKQVKKDPKKVKEVKKGGKKAEKPVPEEAVTPDPDIEKDSEEKEDDQE